MKTAVSSRMIGGEELDFIVVEVEAEIIENKSELRTLAGTAKKRYGSLPVIFRALKKDGIAKDGFAKDGAAEQWVWNCLSNDDKRIVRALSSESQADTFNWSDS